MFTRTAIREAVSRASRASVSTISPVEAGQNHSYRVAFDDGDELFLKVGTRFPDAFPTEPKTAERVDRETEIPVPAVHATGREPLGYPFAIYDFVDDAEYDWVRELPPTAAERLCREAGEHLAELHRITFPRFGRVGVEENAFTVIEPRPYRDALRQSLDRQLGELHDTPFASYSQPLEDLGARLLDRVDFDDVRPALVHGDYRIDNLCIDPTGERVTVAVLDWELPTAGDPLWDVVMTLTVLTEGFGLDPDHRRTLRTAFWEGYGELPSEAARWHCYELLARIRIARHLSTEMENESDAARSARIADHRRAFDDLLDGKSTVHNPSDATGSW